MNEARNWKPEATIILEIGLSAEETIQREQAEGGCITPITSHDTSPEAENSGFAIGQGSGRVVAL